MTLSWHAVCWLKFLEVFLSTGIRNNSYSLFTSVALTWSGDFKHTVNLIRYITGVLEAAGILVALIRSYIKAGSRGFLIVSKRAVRCY